LRDGDMSEERIIGFICGAGMMGLFLALLALCV
jgi:hypothetical protein